MLLSNNVNLAPEEQYSPTFPVLGGDFGVKTHTISGPVAAATKQEVFQLRSGKTGLNACASKCFTHKSV
ncbi:hypothetical protein DPMN_019394 [Dreissena polymorpha]|uniref:Uncharacterized protein n=1 Tax=Dreissena polymorpha TaxID=45954 RepID=A0A9D4NEZ0_DREPO|nr:hypothetical protein DPMN_019394 [Dreissena polymorpha]